MSDDDLIRRGDAVRVAYEYTSPALPIATEIIAAISALPAVTPSPPLADDVAERLAMEAKWEGIKAAEWEKTAFAMQARAEKAEARIAALVAEAVKAEREALEKGDKT